MNRFTAAAISLLMTFTGAGVTAVTGQVSAASAAPPETGTVYGATGTGRILGIDADVLPILAGGLDLADAAIGTSNATTSSIAGTRSAATSSTIAAAVAGLPLTVVSSGQTAPPDNASPTTAGLPDIAVDVPLLLQLSLDALQVSNQARWSGDTSCPADGLLSDSRTTTGDTSLSLADTNLLTLAAADIRNTNALVNTSANAGYNKGVRSSASGTVTDLKLLNGTVTVTVTGGPTLTATAAGSPGGATVTSNANADSLEVSVQIGSDPAVDVPVGTSLAIAGLGTLAVNGPTAVVESADGLHASASWNFLTLDVDLAVASATVQLLPMTASATAPSGGLDCPPPAPVISVPAANAITGPTPTFSGTAEPGASISVQIDGGAAVTTTADNSGNWSVTSPQLVGGPHTIGATQTVGGATSDAATRAFVVAVPAPTITAPPTGTVSNNPAPTITGTGLPGAVVTVLDGTTTAASATVGADSTWIAETTLTPGSHTLTATQRLDPGTDSAASNAVSYVVDTAAPSTVTISSPADGSDTNDTTPTITGSSAEAGASVTVREGATALCTAPVATAGGWRCESSALGDGPHTVTATQTDVAGNVSPQSDPVTFTIDTTAPAAPTISTPVDGSPVASTTPTITGTGITGSTVAVSSGTVDQGGTVLCTATVADGVWSCRAGSLGQGPQLIRATQTDPAGNVSDPSTGVTFTVDTVPPQQLTISSLQNGDLTGDNTPTITGGGAEADATVTVTEGDTVLCTAAVSTTGSWSCAAAPALPDGPHVISAAQQDAAGNVSTPSPTVAFTVDTTAPATLVITAPADGSSTGDTTATISGTGAEAGTELQVREGATVLCTVDPAPSGAWTCTSAVLAEGVHDVAAVQTDPAGNASMPSATVSFAVDLTAPAGPLITAPTEGSEVSGPDVTVTGTGERGATVTVVVVGSSEPPVSGTVQSDGTWSVVLIGLTPGDHTVSARQVDLAGNRSAQLDATRHFTVIPRVSTAPVITTPASESLSRNNKPTVSGTGVPGAVVSLFLDGAPAATGSATVLSTGRWSVTLLTALADGNHTFRATQKAGVTGTASPVSDAVNYFVDTTVAAPVLTVPVNPSRTRNPRPGVNGTGEVGAVVTVTESGGVAWCTAPVAAGGAWKCTGSTTVKPQGLHLLRATQTDRAGNVSGFSPSALIVIDTVAPAAPRFTSPADTSRTYGGDLQIRGIGAPGATLTLRDSTGAVLGIVEVGRNGLWTVPVRGARLGTLVLTATQTDSGGNVSPISRQLTLTLIPGGRSVSGVRAPVITATTDRASYVTTVPRFSGTGHPGAAVTVVDERGVQSVKVRVAANGTWALASRVSTQGAHSYRALQTIGQVQQNGTRRTITIWSQHVQLFLDTVRPAAPTLSAPVTTEPQASSMPVLGGTSEDGTVVSISLDGRAIGSAMAEDAGGSPRWVIRSSVGVAPGNHRVVLTAIDSAGNRSPSTTYSIVTTSG